MTKKPEKLHKIGHISVCNFYPIAVTKKVANWDMANFVHFLGLLSHKIHMLRYIELKQPKNV